MNLWLFYTSDQYYFLSLHRSSASVIGRSFTCLHHCFCCCCCCCFSVLLDTFFLSGTIRYSKFILYISSTSLRIKSAFLLETLVLLLENSTRSQNLHTRCACCYQVLLLDPLSWWPMLIRAAGRDFAPKSKEVPVSILTCVYAQTIKCFFTWPSIFIVSYAWALHECWHIQF